jgi:acyl-CoA dehydrogenase
VSSWPGAASVASVHSGAVATSPEFSRPDPTATAPDIGDAFRRWLGEHADALAPFVTEHPGDFNEGVEASRPLQRLLFDHGWTRLGWPQSCGGLGGSPVLRATVMEELAAAGYVLPEVMGGIEIIAPMLIKYAPHLAATHVSVGNRGDEVWCQGFSEPDAGSDLGSLRTRAVADGEGYRLTGQKMWSSYGTIATWCCVLARTGAADSGYRGLTMMWVDLTGPGITIRPTLCESGRHEVAEIFFDDVYVPADHLIGPEGGGWTAVMYLMQFERGAYAWKRQAELHTQLQDLLREASGESLAANAELVGDMYLSLLALRSQSAATFGTLTSGRDLGPEISVDKLLLSSAEQVMTDGARALLWPALELDDTEVAARWRRRWSFSRITTIYGGAAEVQHDLVSERLLGLPRGR